MAQAQRKKKRSNIPMRRRLADLYEKGQEVRFNEDGVVNRTFDQLEERNEALKEALRNDEPEPEDDPGAVWPTEDDLVVYVLPPNPLQREEALREAAAARARMVLRVKKDDDSPDSLTTRASVAEMDEDDLIDFVLGMDEADRRQEAERSILAEEEWKDFTELQDAMRQWAESDDPEDDEWKPLLKRDLEFGRQVEAEFTRITEASRESLKIVGRNELEERGVKKVIDLSGNAEFMNEYQLWMMHFACRDGDDHDELAFEGPREISSLPEMVSEALANVYREFIETERSAKNSPRAVAGSPLSVPPVAPETSESSTPEESITSETSPGSSRSPSTTD